MNMIAFMQDQKIFDIEIGKQENVMIKNRNGSNYRMSNQSSDLLSPVMNHFFLPTI